MTAASELNSAAVVEVENVVKEVEVKAQAVSHRNNALKHEERCSLHDDTGFDFGSTTARAASPAAIEKVKAFVKATSGNKAALEIIAASAQAIVLPVSSFSRAIFKSFAKFSSTRAARISPVKLRIQQNPVQLWQYTPERLLRASCAA